MNKQTQFEVALHIASAFDHAACHRAEDKLEYMFKHIKSELYERDILEGRDFITMHAIRMISDEYGAYKDSQP